MAEKDVKDEDDDKFLVTKNNAKYNRFIVSSKRLKSPSTEMVRGKFYKLYSYIGIDEEKKIYTEVNSPIIYTLFVSRKKDIVHAVKISDITPEKIKTFFSKLVNEKEQLIEMKDDSRVVYKKYVKKSVATKKDAYRTYKLSGIQRISELDMDETKITPHNKQATGISEKSHERK